MVRFKESHLQQELAEAEPELRLVVQDLGDWIDDSGLAPLVLTDVMRTPSFYGAPTFSYHFVGCAFDARSHHYTKEEKRRILRFLKERCPFPEWDCLLEPTLGARAEHFHVEWNNFLKRREWEQKERAPHG